MINVENAFDDVNKNLLLKLHTQLNLIILSHFTIHRATMMMLFEVREREMQTLSERSF